MHLKSKCVPLLVINLAFIFPAPAFTNDGVLYKTVKISRSRLKDRSFNQEILPAPASGYDLSRVCAHFCSRRDWCNVWCKDPEPAMTCLLFRDYVVPQYKETNLQDALTCYVLPRVDYAVGSTIGGIVPELTLPLRLKENLVDGIHTKNSDECHIPNAFQNPYFRLDMGSVKPVRKIIMVLQPDAYVRDVYNVEVLVGTEDLQQLLFDNYQFFGFFQGPGYEGQEVTFNRSSPIMARYVLFRRADYTQCLLNNVYSCALQVCHIEIS